MLRRSQVQLRRSHDDDVIRIDGGSGRPLTFPIGNDVVECREDDVELAGGRALGLRHGVRRQRELDRKSFLCEEAFFNGGEGRQVRSAGKAMMRMV